MLQSFINKDSIKFLYRTSLDEKTLTNPGVLVWWYTEIENVVEKETLIQTIRIKV